MVIGSLRLDGLPLVASEIVAQQDSDYVRANAELGLDVDLDVVLK